MWRENKPKNIFEKNHKSEKVIYFNYKKRTNKKLDNVRTYKWIIIYVNVCHEKDENMADMFMEIIRIIKT